MVVIVVIAVNVIAVVRAKDVVIIHSEATAID